MRYTVRHNYVILSEAKNLVPCGMPWFFSLLFEATSLSMT